MQYYQISNIQIILYIGLILVNFKIQIYIKKYNTSYIYSNIDLKILWKLDIYNYSNRFCGFCNKTGLDFP